MKFGLSVIALLTWSSAVSAADMNPLGKVLELMSELTAKIIKEGEEEGKIFHDYVEWCDNAAANLHNEIKKGEKKKEELDAVIARCEADIESCDAKIEDLSGAIATDEKQVKEATSVRHEEEVTFLASEKELVDAIDTLSRATAILEKEMSANPASLAQIDTSSLDNALNGLNAVISAAGFSAEDQVKLAAFVQQHSASEDEEPGAPAAATYKTHSTGIFDVLEDMKEKAESQLADLRKAESNAKHEYEMLKQSLDDEMEADTKDLDEEKSLKAATEEKKATAEGDLAETTKELKKDKESLEAASTSCMQVATDHENTVRSRKEELDAIATAVKDLKESTGGAVEQSYSLLQTASKAASKSQSRMALKAAEVVKMVKKLARKHRSAALAQLASRIASVMRYGATDGDDVFGKVKGLVTDMIVKLEAQAKAEATEKAYCDEEMSKTEAKKSELDGVISKLTSKIDLAAAKSAELKGEVKVLQDELATVAKQQAEMDEIRAEEKAAYDTAKSELELGIAGVQKALSTLKDYYGSTALLQGSFDEFMQQPAKPKTFKKAEGAGQSIIDILEVVESDFTKNLADEETQEADAVAVYEKTTQDNKLATADKSQGVKYKTQEFKGLDKTISELSGERDTTDKELTAVLEYFSKLKARCIAKPESYEERKARREAEIQGLKEALQILENETAFMQKSKRSRHHHFMTL